MKMIASGIISLFILAVFTLGTASAQFSISGEFRPRAEYRNGYLKIGDSTMKGYPTLLGRSRLVFDYKNEKIETRFSVQHAFVFGENSFSSDTITKNTVNIFEGWFRYRFTKLLSVKVGRMQLAFDDGRLFDPSNWKQWGATHDMVTLEWNSNGEKYRGTFGFAVNNTAPVSAYQGNYLIRNYKYMTFLHQQLKFLDDKLTISLLGILDSYQMPNTTVNDTVRKSVITWVTNGTDTVGSFTTNTTTVTPRTESHNRTLYARGTLGGTAGFNWKNLALFANGYYQTGHYKDGRKLNAWFIGGWISYQIVKPLGVKAGYEMLSGNDASKTAGFKENVHGFSTLWGTGHTFYGYMDMFQSLLGQDALHNGLNDLYGRVTLKLSGKTSLEGTYRWFSLPYGYLPAKTAQGYQPVSKDLGSEIDLMILYKPLPNLEVNAAWCVYLKTATREILDGLKAGEGRTGQYAYLMITYKPKFFTSEK